MRKGSKKLKILKLEWSLRFSFPAFACPPGGGCEILIQLLNPKDVLFPTAALGQKYLAAYFFQDELKHA